MIRSEPRIGSVSPRCSLIARRALKPTVLFGLSFLFMTLFGCDAINKMRATKIKDLLDHPRAYENKEVTVYGTVTDRTSLVLIKFFEIADDTGRIRVVTSRVLPARGEKIRVTGYLESVEIGSERWLTLREKVPRRDRS